MNQDATTEPPVKLTAVQIDALTEVGNIGACHAANALSKLTLERKIIPLKPPKTYMVRIEQLPDLIGNPETEITGIYFQLNGTIQGRLIMFITIDGTVDLIELLSGQIFKSSTEFTEMEWSLISEVGNICGASYMNAIANFLHMTVWVSPPNTAVDMIGAMVEAVCADIAQLADYALVIDTQFIENSKTRTSKGIDGKVVMMPNLDSLQLILNSLSMHLTDVV